MKLQAYREKNKLSQASIAKILGVDVTTVSKYETGDIFPSLSVFRKIQEMTNKEVKVADFFQGNG